MNYPPNIYQFTLTSAISKILLNKPIICNKIRINSLRYITSSTNNKNLLISISQFNNKINYSNNQNYLKSLFLLNTMGTPLFYENTNNFYDCSLNNTISLSSFTIEITIDNYYSTDVNVNNPVLVEIQFD